ncbi:MAG: 5-methyltetrahydropteroyltriglutamate--homocysteine S-methyltransferase [Anaerolineales bacterium]
MSKRQPPYRADHVGSLLRPKGVLEAREKHQKGAMTAEQLRSVEDAAIAEVVRKQEDIGLRSITDGELRRTYFHVDFLEQLEGVTVSGGIEVKFKGKKGEVNFAPPRLAITGKLRHSKEIQRRDFEYLKSVTSRTPKVTIPSPTMTHFRGGRKAIDIDAYPDLDEFFDDLALVYQKEIDSLYKAGCRYIQLDDTNLAYLCDPKLREGARQRGEDPDQLPRMYAELINHAIEKRSDDLTIAVHLCRGNFRSSWVAEGSYEPVAEVLFNEMNVDAFFLEYDDERSGDFSPLRFVPKNKMIVLGLVTTKDPNLESADELKQRVEEAAKYVNVDNLCLSPQCGFSSTVHGNDLSHEEQWAKLSLVVDTANEIWGG